MPLIDKESLADPEADLGFLYPVDRFWSSIVRYLIVSTFFSVLFLGDLVVTQAGDPFPVGSVWEGTREFESPHRATQEWSLKITERNESQFKGEMTLSVPQGTLTYSVTGDAQTTTGYAGGFNFRSEKKGPFKQSFDGTFYGDEIKLRFSGTAFNGDSVSGKAVLIPLERSRLAKASKAKAEENKKWAAKQKALIAESLKLSQTELQQRLRKNRQRTQEEQEQYAADATALNWIKEQEKEKNKTPEQRERERLMTQLVISLLSQPGNTQSSEADAAQNYEEELARKKVLELEEKFRREAEYERERRQRERDN